MPSSRLILLVSVLLLFQCTASTVRIYEVRSALVVDACPGWPHPFSEVPVIMQKKAPALSALTVIDPLDETIFPMHMPPRFEWWDAQPAAAYWIIAFAGIGSESAYIVTDRPQWVPPAWQWDKIKGATDLKSLNIEIRGFDHRLVPVSSAELTLRFSEDPVDAALFYLEMPLPFSKGEQHPETFRWMIGNPVSAAIPRVVAEGLPVCSNCHCVSNDGRLIGMDMDVDGDKGGYALIRTGRNPVVSRSSLLSWNDFAGPSGRKSMGLFSRLSPDGRYVASTVWEQSFFAYLNDIWYSQFFFPIRGVVAIYDIHNDTFKTLGGADSEEFVQTCPDWHPDGESIVFARTQPSSAIFTAMGSRKVMPTAPGDRIQDLNARHKLRFDLYRVVFDSSAAQPVAQALAGASHNGFSNYFPRHSPDGRWIVFTRSPNGLAIQPESELWIIPSGGGEARRMRCNLSPMNSWHSWSPNSRWLVFSSKAQGPYTRLYLTHVDHDGCDSPPVYLGQFGSPGYACIVPELVNPLLLQIRSIHVNTDLQ